MKIKDRMASIRRLLIGARMNQISRQALTLLAPLEKPAVRAQEMVLRRLDALQRWNPLGAARPVKGKLRATEPGLNAIFVQAVRNGPPEGTLTLELFREGRAVASATVAAEDAPDRPGWLAFRFPALDDSGRVLYRFALRASAPRAGVSVRVVNPATGRIEFCPGYYVADIAGPHVRPRRLDFSVEKLERALQVLSRRGPGEFARRVLYHVAGTPVVDLQKASQARDATYLRSTRWTPEEAAAARAEQERWKTRPLVSVLMPIYKVEPRYLREAIASVRSQVYPNWELVAVDDGTPEPEATAIRAVLSEAATNDARVRPFYSARNEGISGASNLALAEARGEFVALLDHDDVLEEHALWEAVRALQDRPDLDMIYTDEHRISAEGEEILSIFYKPDWSPDRMLSQMYTCHMGFFRTSLVREVGGFRKGFEGSQDWDLVLRVTERTSRIHHVPRSCYGWRAVTGSTAQRYDAKGYAHLAAKKAIADAIARRGLDAEVEEGMCLSTFRVRRRIQGEPLVSVIIPFRDKPFLLQTAVQSVLARTDWKHYELILVDNGSRERATARLLRRLGKDPRIKVLRDERPFNFSALNNFAAQKAQGEHLLFLNNDTEVITPGWMRAMLEHSQRPEVGAVGARLLYPSGQVQHAGVVLGVGSGAHIAGHVHRFLPRQNPGYYAATMLIQNLSAVTAACMMMRRAVFEEVGGFDVEHLAVAFNDVDLCLRVREKGYLIVYTPFAELYHHESISRGYKADNALEVNYMRDRWGKVLDNDPYYNPNLTRAREDFSLKDPSEASRPPHA